MSVSLNALCTSNATVTQQSKYGSNFYTSTSYRCLIACLTGLVVDSFITQKQILKAKYSIELTNYKAHSIIQSYNSLKNTKLYIEQFWFSTKQWYKMNKHIWWFTLLGSIITQLQRGGGKSYYIHGSWTNIYHRIQKRPNKQATISLFCSRWWWWLLVWIKGFLLSAREYVIVFRFLTTNTHQVKVIQVMRYNNIHGIDITLTTDTLAIQNIHGGSKSRSSFGQSVVLCGFPVSNKGFVTGRLSLFERCHPPPDCCLEGQGGVLFDVFWMI